MISQQLFWEVYNLLPLNYKLDKQIFFATLNQETKEKEIGNKNNEYRLTLCDKVILPDFFVFDDKKIIEFDGTYFHRINPENKKRERERDDEIKMCSYEVLHISEHDYKYNKQEIINKCLEFLNIF